MSKILVFTMVHDFSGEGKDDAYTLSKDTDPNEVVNNNLENIFKFNDDVSVVIHVNKDFERFDNSIEDNKVFVSPVRYSIKRHHCYLSAILSSIEHVLNNGIEFEYFLFTQSSEMFVKSNCYEHLKNYEYGSWIHNQNHYGGWIPFEVQRGMVGKKQSLFKDLFNPMELKNYFASQLEGTFYRKELLVKIFNWFKTNYDITSFNDWGFYAEELMFPTVAYHLSEEKNIGMPIVGFFIDKGHVPEKDMINVHKIRNNEIVNIWGPNQFNTNILTPSRNLYTIKRIERNMNDPVRIGISALSN